MRKMSGDKTWGHTRDLYNIFGYLIVFLLAVITCSVCSGAGSEVSFHSYEISSAYLNPAGKSKVNKRISLTIDRLKNSRDIRSVDKTIDSIYFEVKKGILTDSAGIADLCYTAGSLSMRYSNYTRAIGLLQTAKMLFERTGGRSQENYSKTVYNNGVAYYNLGDFPTALKFALESVEIDKKIYGNGSAKMVDGYLFISTCYVKIREYEKAIENINEGLSISGSKPDSVDAFSVARLYGNKGVAFSFLANYDQARNNLIKSETAYNNIDIKSFNPYNLGIYINTLDNLGTVSHYLGSKEKTYYYYERGLKLVSDNLSGDAFNLVNNYSIILGIDSLRFKGETLLSDFLNRAQKDPSYDPRIYFEIKRHYADYLREFNINNGKVTDLYLDCFRYSDSHPWDREFRRETILGYSLSLVDKGQFTAALDSVQNLLFTSSGYPDHPEDNLINPNPDSLTADKMSVDILKTKYQILLREFKQKNEFKMLESAAKTSELFISVLERIRISIGEEGSRILLGEKYRNLYLDAIMSFSKCFEVTDNAKYLAKVFEYSERSKVASLLASTREMKAIQGHVPLPLAEKEKEYQRNVAFYSSAVFQQENNQYHDSITLSSLNDSLLLAQARRDELKRIFEKEYPDYYKLKYNTSVTALKDIPSIIGKNKNYLSFIISDSVLYTLISNKRESHLITRVIDSTFFEKISGLRQILINPDKDKNAYSEFLSFQKYGYNLYSILVEPVKKYLLSDRLVISPDNLLSFIPFEILVTDSVLKKDLLYRNLPYMTNDYRISYTYSATLLAENSRTKASWRNSSLIFSPKYKAQINIDSIMNERQSSDGYLSQLPFAREEGEYVSHITKGSLYDDSSATSGVYKHIAGNFDIIHLAMHANINIQNPNNSRLIFYFSNESSDSIGLKLYEVYGIPLKAKMVFLSSCNTGSGNLRKGEGILSLARGFIYSGSRSVVMSLWEVNDKSGTDIVKSFYKYLKRGSSKSDALRKARLDYLKKADQLSAHPNFWSTLVIYGDDSPLYNDITRDLAIIIIIVILVMLVVVYFRKRWYSR
jgi:CHAT domain-containing protein